ncbi:GL15250 [Drosophila persimilis]|uniref:GL15250 n=1 Tax=Drosophila persimilis TaxID=7234 RepID=B4H3V7_DROPE|nr:GL15250 [Drosophila persimilis]
MTAVQKLLRPHNINKTRDKAQQQQQQQQQQQNLEQHFIIAILDLHDEVTNQKKNKKNVDSY